MFDPIDFFSLSKQICDDLNYNEEARLRTAINRAYYSAFLSCYLLLSKQGKKFKNKYTIHKDVRKACNNLDRTIGNKLEKLHEDYRVPSDYFIEIEITQHMKEMAFLLAEEIFESFKKYQWISDLFLPFE